MAIQDYQGKGLSAAAVEAARKEFGYNRLDFKQENNLLQAIIKLLKEPMVILLLIAASIYFASGKVGDGIFLSFAIIFEISISLYQDNRSKNALEKLKAYTKPKCKVIREGALSEIATEEVVVGDCILVEEGVSIAADGIITQSNDFSVNESIITGESFAVFMDKEAKDNTVVSGTTVASGSAYATVTAIGNKTRLGMIGKSLENIAEEKTPLEIQITSFVQFMAFGGLGVFAVVWGINFFHSKDVLDSLLKALTLALSIMPEEIPVAFTSFMALGAFKLMKLGIVVKQMKTVETLGSATVICTDKTGTITENSMRFAKMYVLSTNEIIDAEKITTPDQKQLLQLAFWASEAAPFDAMEIALQAAYTSLAKIDDAADYSLIKEYPLSGTPPMMTHIWQSKSGKRIIACKGAIEVFLQQNTLSAEQKTQIESALISLGNEGYRVLGVAEASFEGDHFPATQQEFGFVLKGMVAFYDPPKQNIKAVLQQFYDAGITVKIITGDNPITTIAIAKQIDFKDVESSISGDELMQLSDEAFTEKVKSTNLFTRMYPAAKLRIIEALKKANEIVAMTGDGVNDSPALKAAHIGIAMGKKGTEIAKQAASLILVDDDFGKMVGAIAMGRRIYANLKKAIQYIISIHVPIILIVFVPLVLGWQYPNIFSPIHIIFLELVMGPTCSIIYENEPMEDNAMKQPPRPFTTTFFNIKELTTSVIQGLVIAAGALFVYQLAAICHFSENKIRTMVFTTLIVSNIFLTLVNRSFYHSIITTMGYKNNLVFIIISATIAITGLILYVPFVTKFFDLEMLSFQQLGSACAVGFVAVIWFEAVKAWQRRPGNTHFEDA